MHRILIIGDSFVEGVGATGEHGWAQAVAASLPGDLVSVSGEGGDTTDKLLARWPSDPFDAYIVQIGTNDSRFRPSLGANDVPIHKFKKNLNLIYAAAAVE